MADRFAILKNGRLVAARYKEDTTVDEVITMIVSGKTAETA